MQRNSPQLRQTRLSKLKLQAINDVLSRQRIKKHGKEVKK